MAAARLAVPQLITPHEPFDEHVMGRLAAICFRHRDLADDPDAGGRIRDSIDALLSDPGYAKAAALLLDEIERKPSPAGVVATLAALSH